MDFNDYQQRARETEQPSLSNENPIIPLLGLSGEVGELLNEYKKLIRDGNSHIRFKERASEELGDILWYLSEAASALGLSLNAIALDNLEKTRHRWSKSLINDRFETPHAFDIKFPENERLPRQFVVSFLEMLLNNRPVIRAYIGGVQLGQELTDNCYDSDGYRFHDVFHLACAAILGWSPVTRRNLSLKRKSNERVDEVEDGGRAIVVEEAISALVFVYAKDHALMEGAHAVDYSLLKSIKLLTANFEVSVCTTGEWEYTILRCYSVWRELEQNRGGKVGVNLDTRSICYLGRS